MECDFDFVNQKLTFLTRGATKNQFCYKLGQLVIRFSGLTETPGPACRTILAINIHLACCLEDCRLGLRTGDYASMAMGNFESFGCLF